MMKVFALLSVLLFVFKALAADEGKSTAQVQQERLALKEAEYKRDCSDDAKAETAKCKKLQSDIDRLENAIAGITATDPDEKGKTECKEANDKYNTDYKQFIKDQRESTDANDKEVRETEKESRDASVECQEKVRELENQIAAESEKMQEALDAIEKQLEEEDSAKNEQLKGTVGEAQKISSEIIRILGTEQVAVENSFKAAERKLVIECQKSVNAALAEARKFISERRRARNAGVLKFSSVNGGGGARSKDQVDAQAIVDQAYETCRSELKNLQEANDLQLQTLDDRLRDLKNAEASLKGEISKINQELQNSPSKKLREQNKILQKSTEAISRLTTQLAQQRQNCARELAALDSQARELVSKSKAEADDVEPIVNVFSEAYGACCNKGNPKEGFGTRYSALCKESPSKVRKKLGGKGRGRI